MPDIVSGGTHFDLDDDKYEEEQSISGGGQRKGR